MKMQPLTDQVTINDVILQEVNYSTWTEDQLYSEISKRHLIHGVYIISR